MSAIYKWINPPIKFLLASPLHGIMSSNTLLLDFTGRKSGRALSTPIRLLPQRRRGALFYQSIVPVVAELNQRPNRDSNHRR